MLKNDISEQLADLFNLSFTTGISPALLKIAKVIPIHKKDYKLDFTNYRPVSLLSNLDKIFEKLIHSKVSSFLNIKYIIYLLQFGFCQNYSTSYALTHLTESIKEALDPGNMVVGFLLIFKKLLTLLTITFY